MNAFTQDLIRISNQEDIQQAYENAARINAPHLPLFSAAAQGIMALAFFQHPEAEFPRSLLKPTNRALLVVVGDDPPMNLQDAMGPDPWELRKRLRHWAPRFAVVHATGANLQQYGEIVTATLIMHRLLLVETGSEKAMEWAHALEGLCPISVWLPTNGVHPIPEPRH